MKWLNHGRNCQLSAQAAARMHCDHGASEETREPIRRTVPKCVGEHERECEPLAAERTQRDHVEARLLEEKS